MYKRQLEATLHEYLQFPVVALLGPRQSGKTTLVKHAFPNYTYTSFEDPVTRELAIQDPLKFFRIHENEFGIIIDEFQRVPDILSYIQLSVDEKKRPGYFILTGSQNFLMNQAITQSLAGRVGILNLLPLSIAELDGSNLFSVDNAIDIAMFNGGYPRLYAENFTAKKLYPSYIQSYIERDVRQIANIGDLRSFQRFMQLCAARTGQIIQVSEIAGACGVGVATANRWISILEASYILFFLQPHFTNFNKRITKSPKLYFYDTGIVCSLLNIQDAESLALHGLRGSIFETFIIADIYKQYFNMGEKAPVYFWRDLNGRIEVDCILDQGIRLIPIEIKSGETFSSRYFDALKKWNQISNTSPDRNYIIYGGDLKQSRSAGNIVGWKASGSLISVL